MKETLFHSALRAFLVVLFGIAGFTVGIFFLLIIFASTTSSMEGTPEIEYKYKVKIQPNAEGVRKELSRDAPVILQINITGVIGMDGTKHTKILEQFIESNERSLKGRVKAVLLYMDTPGGTVVDADEIYHTVKWYKEKHKIPVYAFVDGLCASGGMYVAASADMIYSTDASLIGSVGVILPTIMNFSKLLDRFGIDTMTIYEGKGKDNLNPLRPWVKGEEDNIKDATQYYYEQFVNILTSNRPHLDKTKLINDYGANIYPAEKAKEYGYVDVTGADYFTTVRALAEKIDIKDDYYQVVGFESKSFIEHLFSERFDLLSGEIKHRIQLSPELDPELLNQYLYLYMP